MTGSATFRADHVGSLLRPPALLGARQRRDAGEIGPDELRAIEDDAIAAVVAAQQETGISVLTDGEFRRRDFRTGFVEAVDGITMRTFDMPWHTSSGMTKLPSKSFTITGRLKQRTRLAEGEAAYLKSLTPAAMAFSMCSWTTLARARSSGRTGGSAAAPRSSGWWTPTGPRSRGCGGQPG